MTGWVAANCTVLSIQSTSLINNIFLGAIISVLVIHSFGRVVRRHEKDALLFQHPSAWWERDMNHRSPYSRRGGFPGPLRVRVPAEEDPFSDARGMRESGSSWNSGFSDSPSSPPAASMRDRRLSLPSPYPDLPTSNRNTLFDILPPDSTDISSLNAGQSGGKVVSFGADEKTVNRTSHV